MVAPADWPAFPVLDSIAALISGLFRHIRRPPARPEIEPVIITALAHIAKAQRCRRARKPSGDRAAASTASGSPTAKPPSAHANLNVNAGGQFQLHQRIHRLVGGLDNIEQSLVGTQLVLIARILVL